MIKTLLGLIGPKRKKRMLALIPAMLLASLLEMAGLAVVVSVCASLVDGAWLHESQVMLWLRQTLHLASDASLTAVMLLALIALYVFKLPYLAWENYMVAKFVRTTRHEVSTRLCSRIVRSPYPFFMHHSTAELQNLLGQDMFQLSAGLDGCMQILMELPVVAGLGICLLLVDPLMTLFVAGGIVCLVVLTRVILIRPIRAVSTRQRDANRRRWKWLHQIVEGIKDIKTGQHESFYEACFAKANAEYERSDYLRQFWLKLPALCIECVMVLSVLTYLLYLVGRESDLLAHLPGLSALAWTAVRLLPAFSRINTSLTQIGYAKASVHAIGAMMEQTAPAPAGEPAPQTRTDIREGIELRHVSYTYAGSQTAVLHQVDMQVRAGTAVGIIGSSGAGKTTLLDILLGLLAPDQGEVLVDGIPIGQCYAGFLDKIAYVPQTTFLLDDTIRNNVAMGEEPDQIDDGRVWAALEQAALAGMVRALGSGLDTQIGEHGIRLSGGERQRLGLARAMYRDPAVIVLDEATSALDLETEAAVLRSVEALRGGKTLIVVSHRQSAIDGCDAVYRVQDGTVLRER